MQRNERQLETSVSENVIFDSSIFESIVELQNPAQITRIMDIPGTAHEKLLVLSEME